MIGIGETCYQDKNKEAKDEEKIKQKQTKEKKRQKKNRKEKKKKISSVLALCDLQIPFVIGKGATVLHSSL